MRYILWVVALLGAYDVTKNGRHLCRRLGFYQGLEIIIIIIIIVTFIYTRACLTSVGKLFHRTAPL